MPSVEQRVERVGWSWQFRIVVTRYNTGSTEGGEIEDVVLEAAHPFSGVEVMAVPANDVGTGVRCGEGIPDSGGYTKLNLTVRVYLTGDEPEPRDGRQVPAQIGEGLVVAGVAEGDTETVPGEAENLTNGGPRFQIMGHSEYSEMVGGSDTPIRRRAQLYGQDHAGSGDLCTHGHPYPVIKLSGGPKVFGTPEQRQLLSGLDRFLTRRKMEPRLPSSAIAGLA